MLVYKYEFTDKKSYFLTVLVKKEPLDSSVDIEVR